MTIACVQPDPFPPSHHLTLQLNYNEAVNFATREWLSDDLACVRKCASLVHLAPAPNVRSSLTPNDLTPNDLQIKSI